MLVAGMRAGQRQAEAQMAQQQQQQAEVEQARQQGAAQAQTAAPAKDVTAELQKLAELHKSGVLSDAEFTAAKQKLLG
jgi:membrane protease subunit (stomatin/prohibitin family)